MRTTTVTTTVVIETDDDDLRGRVETLEEHMSELDDTLADDEAQFAGYRSDVDAKLAAMQTQIDTLTQQVADGDPAALTTAKSLQTAIAEARASVGDANNDGDPAAPTT